jgi:hypothetical protein
MFLKEGRKNNLEKIDHQGEIALSAFERRKKRKKKQKKNFNVLL